MNKKNLLNVISHIMIAITVLTIIFLRKELSPAFRILNLGILVLSLIVAVFTDPKR